MSNSCNWTVRPGTNDSYFAFTPCKRGFNYLSRVNKPEDIPTVYNGKSCPICGRRIKIIFNAELWEEVEE